MGTEMMKTQYHSFHPLSVLCQLEVGNIVCANGVLMGVVGIRHPVKICHMLR